MPTDDEEKNWPRLGSQLAEELAMAPPNPVGPGRTLRVGTYRGTVFDPSFRGLPISPLGALLGRPPQDSYLPGGLRWIRRQREKRWIYFSATGRDLFLGLGIVHAGYMGRAFLDVFDRRSGARTGVSVSMPLAAGIEVQASPASGSSHVRGLRLDARTDLQPDGRLRASFRSWPNWGSPPIAGLIEFDLPKAEPISVIGEFERGWPGFTWKAAAIPVAGRVRLGGEILELHPDTALGAVDYTRSFFPHHTCWRWASLVGRTSDGRPVGLNLASGVYERPGGSEGTGSLENILWIDGQPRQLCGVRFRRTARNSKPWTITGHCHDSRVELCFGSPAEQKQEFRLGPLSSSLTQALGSFSGTVKDKSGREIDIDQMFGIVEDHEARW